jgi:DMSO/TMAO reductase YedYZ molybdopterin-dependent catalytic subunit
MRSVKQLAWLAAILLIGVLGAMNTTAARPQTAAPNDATLLVVKGEVKQELDLSAADLKAMPRVKVTAKDHDGIAREHEGVALQTLLAKAGVPQGGELRGKNMTLIVVADATDGYRAAFSLAELDADFAGAQAIVEDLEDGKPLDVQHGPLRLIVPGDKHQARWVRLLKNISVQKAAESH